MALSREEQLARKRAQGRVYYAKNREKIIARASMWNTEFHIRRLSRNFVRQYGITYEEYQNLARSQNFCCLICKAEEWTIQAGRLYVDHDHDTGEVRGLLCDKCNRGLGCFNDRADLMEVALRYLRRTQPCLNNLTIANEDIPPSERVVPNVG